MHHRTYNRIIVIVVGSILLISLYSSIAFAESAQPKPIIKVLVLPVIGYAPFFIAEEEGYFTEQGLQIEYIKIGGGTSKALPALVQGDLDVLPASVNIGMLNTMIRGSNIKMVADKGYVASSDCPYIALLARRTLTEQTDLSQPDQLKGRTVAVNPMSVDGYYVESVLRRAGLTLEDVQVKYIPSSTRLEAVKTGAIDLIKATEPWIIRILRTGNAVLWVPAYDVIPDFQYGVVLYGPTLLTKNPDAGKQFMIAYLKAVRQYKQGKTERNVAILSKHTGLEQELVREACWPMFHDNGYINIASVIDFQEWGVKKKLLDRIVTTEQFWDSRFIEYANPILETP